MKVLPVALLSALVLASCGTKTEAPALTKSGLDPQKFASEYRGDSVALYTLVNANGMEACITNFGGRVVSLLSLITISETTRHLRICDGV